MREPWNTHFRVTSAPSFVKRPGSWHSHQVAAPYQTIRNSKISRRLLKQCVGSPHERGHTIDWLPVISGKKGRDDSAICEMSRLLARWRAHRTAGGAGWRLNSQPLNWLFDDGRRRGDKSRRYQTGCFERHVETLRLRTGERKRRWLR